MKVTSNRDAVDRFLAALATRDVATLSELIAPDAVEEYPQSGERLTGRDNIIAAVRNYPGGLPDAKLLAVAGGEEDRWVMTPAYTVLNVEGSGNHYTCAFRAEYPDSGVWYGWPCSSSGMVRS
ncbi:MAG: nuclear transport factor 2 family protein [Chloroflexi bacterium]|nr:nuclear transport factor 2 family protein [Chloroflexota bacterium]